MVNEILSPEMQVEPLAEGVVVVYKLLNADKVHPNIKYEDGSEYRSSPASVSFEGKDYVIDPFDKSKPRKMIGYETGMEVKEDTHGRPYEKKSYGEIVFSGNGYLFVTNNDLAKYQFMERMNANKSNPYRDKRKKAYFEKLNQNEALQKEIDSISIEWEAFDLILHSSKTEIENIAQNLPAGIRPNLNNPFDVIKGQLAKIAKENPRQIIQASGNERSQLRMRIRDAHKYDLILFDDVLRKWHLKTPEGMTELADVPVGKEMYEVLLKFFLNPIHKKKYEQFVQLMRKITK